ncbi:MAG: hypothetical protein ABUL77_02985 [Bacteroidota bacterium]
MAPAAVVAEALLAGPVATVVLVAVVVVRAMVAAEAREERGCLATPWPLARPRPPGTVPPRAPMVCAS